MLVGPPTCRAVTACVAAPEPLDLSAATEGESGDRTPGSMQVTKLTCLIAAVGEQQHHSHDDEEDRTDEHLEKRLCFAQESKRRTDDSHTQAPTLDGRRLRRPANLLLLLYYGCTCCFLWKQEKNVRNFDNGFDGEITRRM